MIRNPLKIGSVNVSDGGNEPIEIDIKHQGTFGKFIFQGWNGGTLCAGTALADALANLTLSVDHQNGDGFALLNKVTPSFLNYRDAFHYETIGVAASASQINFDPAAGVGKDEGRRNQLTIGTADLKAMTAEFQYSADTTGCTRIDIWADVDFNLKQELGDHVRIGSQSVTVPAGGGQVEISTIPFDNPNLCLNALHFEEPAHLSVADWTVAINSKQYPYRDVPQVIINRWLEYRYRSPQAGFATVDFNKEDVPAYFFETGLGSLLVTPNFADDGAGVTSNGRLWYEQIFKDRKAA